MSRDQITLSGSLTPGIVQPAGHRSGFVTLVGRPNVGKSTLLNALLGHKVTIVSDKPQTTRTQVRGVLTRSDGLFNQLLKKNIVAGYILALLTYAIGAVFMGLIIWGSVPYLIDAWKDNYYIGVEGMFTAPVWPIALITVIGVTVTMVQFIIILADYFRLLNSRD